MSSFQISSFKEIAKSYSGKNLIVSPLSIYYILSLVANGAKDNTLFEMLKALFHQSKEEMNNVNKSITSLIQGFKSVFFANGIFTKVLTENNFLQIAKEYTAKVDLLKDAPQINSWCKEATHDKIPQIIDSISPNDLMVLINAIYFKGDWMEPFEEKDTKNDTFLNHGKEPKQVDFMKTSKIIKYKETDEAQLVSLRYVKDFMEALIILPKNNTGLDEFMNNLTEEKYIEIIKNMGPKKVNLSLPKFEVKFEAELKQFLIALGMNQAFSEEADFTDMIKEKAFIGRVLHKTFLNVNEKGTEAGAATGVLMSNAWCPPETPKDMNVNHPFLFIVRTEDLPSGHDILFISKIEEL